MEERARKLKSLEERARRMKVEFIDLLECEIPRELADKIPFSFAKQFRVVPVKIDGEKLTVALENPTDLYIREQLEARTKMPVNMVLADTDDILKTIGKIYSQVTAEEVELPALSEPEFDQITNIINPDTILWLKNVIVNSLNRNASDVHIETYKNEIKVRYRIDGVIAESSSLPRSMESQIHNLIKSISHMKLEKRNVPQDGIIYARVRGKEIAVRIGSLPTFYGERFIMRVVDEKQLTSTLDSIGLSPENLKKVKALVRRRQGLVLMSGPAGSGVSSTLYAVLQYVSRPEVNVFSIEDPIGAPLPNVNQIQVNPRVGFEMQECIRSAMKHDPDIIMIAKVRDKEVAKLLIESALTGQLVIAGIYARDAIDTITRLTDLGIDPYFIATTLLGVTAQRLARLVCPRCASIEEMSAELERDLRTFGIEGPYEIQGGKGCTYCLGTGYKGRIGLYEVLPISDSIKSLILACAPRAEIEKKAFEEGMKSLLKDGLEKIAKGLTTYNEIKRVLIE